jgi:hypothetical protein
MKLMAQELGQDGYQQVHRVNAPPLTVRNSFSNMVYGFFAICREWWRQAPLGTAKSGGRKWKD